MESAIPLITIDDADNSFVVNDEAIALLSAIETKVCVTAVAGLYRTGKSSLLNWLANRSKGFTVGPTINRCTRGIWMWGEPIMCTMSTGEECACIILDTEGLGGVESNLKYDTRIFSLIVLLCSTLIYNGLGSIDENAISNLSLVTQLSESIKLSNNPGGDDTLNFHKVFPSFIWVIRDFALELEDEDGYEITPTQYLNVALEQNPGYDKQTMERNRIRHMLTSFFPDRECVTLIRPVSDEDALQQVDDLDFSDLRKEFQEGVEGLRRLIFHQPRAKTIDGKMLSGSMFGGLVRGYVRVINEGGVPTISSAWEGVSQQECQEACESGLDQYTAYMVSALRDHPLPVESTDLLERHNSAEVEALQLFYRRAVGPSAEMMAQELKKGLVKLFQNYEKSNTKEGDAFCSHVLTELYDSLIRVKLAPSLPATEGQVGEAVGGRCVYSTDMQQFRQDWESLLRMYSEQARGPTKWRVLSATLKEKMFDCSDVIVQGVTNEYEQQLAVLQGEVQTVATRLSAVDAEYHVLHDSAARTDARNKELEEKIIDLEVHCKSQDSTFSDLSSRHSDLLTKCDDEAEMRRRAETKMKRASERVAELEVYENSCFELTREKDALHITIAELEEEVLLLKKSKKKCVIS